MSEKTPELSFSELLRLLRHLRKGGTRKGACGWAGITCGEFERKLSLDEKFARAVEKAESYGLAQDEIRLEAKVRDGDREALLFRLKMVYGYSSKVRVTGEALPRIHEPSKEYTELEKKISALGAEQRKELVAAYRESAGS